MTLSQQATEALDRAEEARRIWWSKQHTKSHQRLFKAYLDACKDLCTILITERKSRLDTNA